MSRLLDNSNQIRNELDTRNLYTPENPYNLDEGNVVKTINTLASIITPFDSFDVSNTLAGRLNGIETPISQIGLAMLGKQFAATVRSLGSAEFLPSVNFANLFDGDPATKLVTRKVDLQITRRENQTNIGRILEELTGNYRPINPFQKGTTSEDYFRNSGVGQQQFIAGAINKNWYNKSNRTWVTTFEGEGFEYTPALWFDQNTGVQTSRKYFSGVQTNLYPFLQYDQDDIDAINTRLNQELTAFRNSSQNRDSYLEYGSSQDFLDAFGRANTKTNGTLDSDNQLNDPLNNVRSIYDDYGLNDNSSSRIIWGRDGATDRYKSLRNALDPNPNESPTGDLDNINFNQLIDRFSDGNAPRTGLLNYTKELLNSKGKYGNFDLTKKKFVDRETGDVYFNGSPLSTEIDGTPNRSRQHNITDPYNRFVKAIRFRGNEIYNGNENSTIHKRVIPKIHPVIEGDTVNVKSLMFSIENLASAVYRDESKKVAYLDDEFGTQLPFHEAGEQGGRLMWFAPYDIKFSEQSIARHETTMFIGRSEPIYTYNNSERLGTLSFKLLIDYPPHIKGLDHISASRFFAFGGVNENTNEINIDQAEADLQDKINQRDEITPETEPVKPTTVTIPNELVFYFPNDEPRVGSVAGSVQSIIDRGYEDGIDANEIDGRDFGLNREFIRDIEDAIDQAFSDPDNQRPFIDINIVGEATQLFNGGEDATATEYNKQLSIRRAEALKDYISTIYQAKFNTTPDRDGVLITTTGLGLERAPESTSTTDSIPDEESKTYRRGSITFIQNEGTVQRPRELTEKQIRERNDLDIQIQEITTKINKAKEQLRRGFLGTFNQYTIQDGIFKGFRGTETNKFQPVFHSQTPEDFHRRLTFLQQCVRQGNAIRRTDNPSDGTTNFVTKNAVFGRQPIAVLRLGDFMHTKIVIDNISFEYGEAPWDLNPEGMGAQFMYADITMQFKIIGGQSLAAPIDALQNAVSFNYYANSTYYNDGIYATPTRAESEQVGIREQIIKDTNTGIRERNDVIDQIARKIEQEGAGQN